MVMKTMEFIKANKEHQGKECLIWPFSRDLKRGYGYAWTKGKTVAAHREMCRAAHGEPPFAGACATHTCGKGHEGCVNPRHLRWATQRQNIADKEKHGTVRRGEQHVNAKLTEQQVIAAYHDPRSCRKVAAELGCSWVCILHIRNGTNWSWLTRHNIERAA
jgi:hypothetical protein